MKKTLLLAAATAAIAQSASAFTTGPLNASNNPQLAAPSSVAYSGSFTVPQFDTTGNKFLTGITLNIPKSGSVAQSNNDTTAGASLGADVTINFAITVPSGPAVGNSLLISVPLTAVGPSGSTATVNGGPTTSGAAVSAANFAAFSNAGPGGTINLPLDVTLGGITFPIGFSSGNFTTTTLAQTSLSVTYDYDIRNPQVPEPSFYGAMGALVCFGLLGYRQYRVKQNA